MNEYSKRIKRIEMTIATAAYAVMRKSEHKIAPLSKLKN